MPIKRNVIAVTRSEAWNAGLSVPTITESRSLFVISILIDMLQHMLRYRIWSYSA